MLFVFTDNKPVHNIEGYTVGVPLHDIKKQVGATMNYFTAILKEYRKSRKLSQTKVAEAIGLTRSAYSYYETGKTNPSCELIIKLSEFYRTDYSTFIEAIKKDVGNKI